MNHVRQEALLQGQSGIARKVFSAVPITEPWTGSQIRAELARLGATNDIRIIDGCLRSLAECGLIREVGRGTFQRKPEKIVVEPQPRAPAKADTPAATVGHAPTPTSPLDVLISISERVAAIGESVKEIKKDIDDAAIMIEQRFVDSEAANLQLTQLRALLKSI